MTDINIAKSNIETAGFVDIDIDVNLDIFAEIERLKKEKNAIILAHYYQEPDIQDVADFIGDSLGLAQQAEQTKADIIVFAGVHFMAETAKILNPGKKVLLPDLRAGCSLSDSAPPALFKMFKDKHPDHLVITYINCSAGMKALSDIICTSSNAEKIIESIPVCQYLCNYVVNFGFQSLNSFIHRHILQFSSVGVNFNRFTLIEFLKSFDFGLSFSLISLQLPDGSH